MYMCVDCILCRGVQRESHKSKRCRTMTDRAKWKKVLSTEFISSDESGIEDSQPVFIVKSHPVEVKGYPNFCLMEHVILVNLSRPTAKQSLMFTKIWCHLGQPLLLVQLGKENARASKNIRLIQKNTATHHLSLKLKIRLHLNAMFLLMKQELAKSKPQTGSMTSLMDRTFAGRRQWILDEIKEVDEICEKYPCLCKSTFVSQWHVAFCIMFTSTISVCAVVNVA